MKLALSGLALAITLQGCTNPPYQVLSNSYGRYKVVWSGGRVRQIECSSPQVPGGSVVVYVKRATGRFEITVRSSDRKIWAEEVLTPEESRSRSAGIVFRQESHYEGFERIEVLELSFEGSGVLIY